MITIFTYRSRNQGPIGPGKYGYGKAPYILPLQTDTMHTPQRLRRQRPPSRPSRSSQGASATRHGYHLPAHQLSAHGPLYQSENGPHSGLQTSEASIYQLPLTNDQGFPAASSLFHSPETGNSHGVGAHRADPSFPQPLRSAAISCIGAYRQYKLCNTNVSTHQPRPGLQTAVLSPVCLLALSGRIWSRNQGPIGPGKYGYGKAPYILPLQTDTMHTPQRLRRQRPPSRPSRSSQGASATRHGYHLPAHQLSAHGPLYQSENGPHSGLQTSEASIYQLPLTNDQGFPAASSLFHSPETGNSHGVGAHRADPSFPQPLRSAAISCIGAYRQYKLCNTNACPESSRSIREVQCASYNNKPFMGRFYEWEPFAEGAGIGNFFCTCD
ncbi:thrombospondin type-1 domain-containing protein 4-like [Fukomys damarensis]|uniref:thrombospondin type-1 domain-containing protein 4-like n=1 Tax=Fukomys damarensis TaxID=885580 RepID=UPI0005401593|nr:thrombospondin type-1 domain-containing protein 4-like [Fukomys damarensis]